MTRKIVLLAVAIAGLFVSGSVTAGELMPPHVASQLGLTEAWKRYVPVPAGAQSIAAQQLHVHLQNPREYVEVSVPIPDDVVASAGGATTRVLTRIPTDRVGTDGKPIGKEEAQRLASHDVRRLKRRGFDATMTTRIVPRVHLYTLGNDGTLDCRDAETGEPIWMTRVGDRGLAYGKIGVSDDHISVINGANLIQIDITNGEVMEEVSTMSTPMHGAIHAGRFSLVPTVRDGVEGYPMYDPTLDPFMEVVAGIALALPTKAPDADTTRVAWGTSQGFVYVMEMSGEPSVLFRLNTDGIVSGRIAAAPGNRFFFGSEAGQVYAIRATRTGKVLWSKPFGEPFYNGPMLVDDKVLIRSTYGNLFSLSAESGIGNWNEPSPSVDELIGAIGNHIFVRTLSGSLAVIDLETGRRVGSFPDVQPRQLLVNTLTDRLYMVSDSGAVQCLRPINAEMPTFTENPDIQPKEAKPAVAAPAQQPSSSPFPDMNNNPFGADPDANNNPFGADDMNNPFGDAGDESNPFGTNDNPFGN